MVARLVPCRSWKMTVLVAALLLQPLAFLVVAWLVAVARLVPCWSCIIVVVAAPLLQLSAEARRPGNSWVLRRGNSVSSFSQLQPLILFLLREPPQILDQVLLLLQPWSSHGHRRSTPRSNRSLRRSEDGVLHRARRSPCSACP